jgi:hypothetical protein
VARVQFRNAVSSCTTENIAQIKTSFKLIDVASKAPVNLLKEIADLSLFATEH